MELKICHLYPDVLNLYGDRGNILCLQKRLEWRGIECGVDYVKLGDHNDLTGYDLFFIGGGQDFDQEILLEDLRVKKGPEIRAALEDGRTFLCICGGYQMMGHYYETADGEKCEFLGAIDFYTVGGKKRMIGNYAFRLGEESGGRNRDQQNTGTDDRERDQQNADTDSRDKNQHNTGTDDRDRRKTKNVYNCIQKLIDIRLWSGIIRNRKAKALEATAQSVSSGAFFTL